jgi:hypothetical protein
MKFSQRQDPVVAEITSTEIRDEVTIISAKAEMGRYGRVRFTVNLETSGDAASGKAYGGGQGALEDGGFVAGTFTGCWRRTGTQIVVHGIDQVTNGDMSHIVFGLDARGDAVTVTHYSLDDE